MSKHPQDQELARRKLLMLGLWTAPAVVGVGLVSRPAAAQSCAPASCGPGAANPCDPDKCPPDG